MQAPPSERRSDDRRSVPDRRFVVERRIAERRRSHVPIRVERRSDRDRRVADARRITPERRLPLDRRSSGAPLATHLRAAVELLERVSQGPYLSDEGRRDLDAAVFRLRFALDRMAGETNS